MHWLTRIAVFQRWITIVITAALIGVSIFATLRLEQEMIPDIDLPMTTVIAVYPGASPDEVMNEVAVPIDEVVSGTHGLEMVASTSLQNMAVVFAEYEYGTDMGKVNAAIERGLERLVFPLGVTQAADRTGDQNPKVYPLNMNMIPVVVLTLTGDLEPNELDEIADTMIVPELEKVAGVFSVTTEGGQEKVLIGPIATEMNARGISAAQIVTAVKANQYGSLGEIEATPLTASTVVGDVASVAIGPAPGTAVTRTNGDPSVAIVVMKDPEANTVAVANEVAAQAKMVQETLAAQGYDEVQLLNVFDQSDYVERSIRELANEAVVGGILAVLVIFIFLLTVRGSLIIAISIPLSILIGFLVMSIWGLTINLFTLGAMGIAVGRIVDDSIVMLEVIYRRLHKGEGLRMATLEGSKEIAMPIASATFATVAIFLPLAFVGGIVGELFVPFALTISFALLASLLVSLTVVPALAGLLVPKKIRAEGENTWYQRLYVPALKWVLGHRAISVAVALILFIGSLLLIPVIGTSFIPSMGEPMMVVDVEMPVGTDIQTTSETARQIEDIIDEAGSSNVELYYTTVGTSSSFVGGMSAVMGGSSGTNTATVEIMLSRGSDPEKEAAALQDLINEAGIAPPSGQGGIVVKAMDAGMGGFSSNDFLAYIKGDAYADVLQAADELTARLAELEGLSDIKADVAITLPTPVVDIDQAKLAFHVSQGLRDDEFKVELMGLMNGTETGVALDGKGLLVLGATGSARSAAELGDLIINSAGLSYPVKLAHVASADIVDQPTSIKRIDGQRAATISAVITQKDIGAASMAAQDKIDEVEESNPQTSIRIGGVAEEMKETFGNMGIAIIVAIFISFAIVVASFRSLLNALIIMISLPLASIGALVGLLIAGYPLGASAMMGMLMLVGIVLTNAIVLLALVDQLRKSGVSTYDALVQAGRTRIRPILMTALTTMIALVPLAVGLQGESVLIASELAVVVLGGLLSSTVLTLLVIPVIYSLTDRIRRRAPVRVAAAGKGVPSE
ncbi:MAG: efflux RND transporter permease subunit [Chloroflexi bacterium]|nr:efflux RND transporter permease subunit [Chloroflexota bacterium]